MQPKGQPQLVSLDIGNGYVKAISSTKTDSFPSVLATEQGALNFESFSAGSDFIIEYAGTRYAIGDTAWKLGRMRVVMMDRHRVGTDFYKALFVAALTSAVPRSGPVSVIFSLPVIWYSDRENVRDQMAGEYKVCRGDVEFTYTISTDDIRIVPEGFGTVALMTLNEKGEIFDRKLASSRIGVVDIGTLTTDFILFDDLEIIPTKSDTLESALSDVWKFVGENISKTYGRDLEPHEVDMAIHDGAFKSRGKLVDIQKFKDKALSSLAAAVAGRIASLWKGGDEVDNIILTGGGARLIYPHLDFPHKFLVDDAHIANCQGAYRYAIFKSARGGK